MSRPMFPRSKLLPFWDALRGDLRFEKIVASLRAKRCSVSNQVKRGRRETHSGFHLRLVEGCDPGGEEVD